MIEFRISGTDSWPSQIELWLRERMKQAILARVREKVDQNRTAISGETKPLFEKGRPLVERGKPLTERGRPLSDSL